MEKVYQAIDADVAFFPQQDVSYDQLVHVCYKNIVQQLERTGLSRENMHFAGRYTYGITIKADGTMVLSYREIAGADTQYLSAISLYSPFHKPEEKVYGVS